MSPIFTNPPVAKKEAENLIGHVEKQQKKLLEDFSKAIKELEDEKMSN